MQSDLGANIVIALGQVSPCLAMVACMLPACGCAQGASVAADRAAPPACGHVAFLHTTRTRQTPVWLLLNTESSPSVAIPLPEGVNNVQFSAAAPLAGCWKRGEATAFGVWPSPQATSQVVLLQLWVTQFAFSPSGSSLVFAGGPSPRDLYLAAAPDWQPPALLTHSPDEMESSPSWSADGRAVIFLQHSAALGGSANRICALDTDTGQERTLCETALAVLGTPKQGATNGPVAFTHTQLGQSPHAEEQSAQVCLVPFTGGAPVAIASLVCSGSSLAWNRDGSALALVGAPTSLEVLRRHARLYVMTPGNNESKFFGERVDSFVWLPDGQHIVLSQGEPGSRKLALLDVPAAQLRPVGPTEGDAFAPQTVSLEWVQRTTQTVQGKGDER